MPYVRFLPTLRVAQVDADCKGLLKNRLGDGLGLVDLRRGQGLFSQVF